MSHINIAGNYGELIVDSVTGEIILYHHEGYDGDSYKEITKFDIPEFLKAYGYTEVPTGHYDILDFGFWLKDGTYERAVEDHREMVREGWGSVTANLALGKVLQ